ncbi:MAG: chromosomal replication initiator protein DnaA [bacterium]
MQVIWDEFLKIIREEAGNQVVETWFKAVSLEEWNPASNQVTLKAPNQFVRKWIQEHYTELLKTHLARLLHRDDIRLLFLCKEQETKAHTIIPASVVQNSTDTQAHSNLAKSYSQKPTHQAQSSHRSQLTQKSPYSQKNTGLILRPNSTPQSKKSPHKDKESSNLNENYTFTSFVSGPSNSLAFAAAHALCNDPGKAYNPLFIYGGTGLGKTHLLHAIGNETKKRNPSLVIRYETSDQFINEFINAIRFDKTQHFRSKYLKIDFLLVDDIQFLSNKEQTQEMFFHLFNMLHEQKKQIVLSSDTFPKEIKGLQARLKSRLEWGLVADIQMPDLETKIAILKKKAALHSMLLPDDVADFIASRVLSNIRELEGALIRVNAFASLTNQAITLEMAHKVLLSLNEKKQDGLLLENILKIIAHHYSVSVNDIKAKNRHQDIITIRQVSFYLMKKLTNFSLQSIGSFVGGRDHSTVIHAVGKVKTLMQEDTEFIKTLKSIEQKILMHQ